MTPRDRASKTYNAVCESMVKITESPFPNLDAACQQKIGNELDFIDSCMELEIVLEFLRRIQKRQVESAVAKQADEILDEIEEGG